MGEMVRRRFLTATGALLAAPFIATAMEPGKVWRIGYVHLRSGPSERDEAFREELRRRGYVEGQDLVIVDRWTSGATYRLPQIVAEYAGLNVDAIVASSVQATEAARRATSSIPIVMSGVLDPVGNGLVHSLSRPGGNVTGMSTTVVDLSSKRMELLRDLLPNATKIGVLIQGLSPGDTHRSFGTVREAALRLKFELIVEYAKVVGNFPAAIEAISRRGAQGLIVLRSGPAAIDNRNLLVTLVAKERLPAIYDLQEFVDAGGLMSYGYNVDEVYRRAADYLDRIFKGARPAELPVEQPTMFELVMNSKAAAEIGLRLPQPLLLRADRIIGSP
jgi:putative ABC transport system substrate-binding protein